MGDLVERLRAMYSHRGDGLPTQLVNPDGPEAADDIAALREIVSEFDRIVGEISILSNPDWTARPDNALDQIHALTGEVIGGILRRRDDAHAHLLTKDSDNG